MSAMPTRSQTRSRPVAGSRHLHVRDLLLELLDPFVALDHAAPVMRPDRPWTNRLATRLVDPLGDPAVHDNGCVVGHAEHGAGELLDHEDRHALLGDLRHDLVELLDDDRRQSHRQLVEDQQRRIGGQATGHGEHLLLAAGQRPGDLGAPLLQPGEAGVAPAPRSRPGTSPV